MDSRLRGNDADERLAGFASLKPPYKINSWPHLLMADFRMFYS